MSLVVISLSFLSRTISYYSELNGAPPSPNKIRPHPRTSEYDLGKRVFTRSAGLPRQLSGKESICLLMQETQEMLDQEDPLEKEMATHSSILAWKIPWMAEPGRLLSMGSQISRSLTNLVSFFMRVYSVMSDSVTPWTVTHQTTLSVELSRQEYQSGLISSSKGSL